MRADASARQKSKRPRDAAVLDSFAGFTRAVFE
jgi:hypothetical protein